MRQELGPLAPTVPAGRLVRSARLGAMATGITDGSRALVSSLRHLAPGRKSGLGAVLTEGMLGGSRGLSHLRGAAM